MCKDTSLCFFYSLSSYSPFIFNAGYPQLLVTIWGEKPMSKSYGLEYLVVIAAITAALSVPVFAGSVISSMPSEHQRHIHTTIPNRSQPGHIAYR